MKAFVATAIGAISLTLFAAPAGAQVRPHAQIQLSRGAVTPAQPAPRVQRVSGVQHTVFGTMGQIGPRRFLLKLRTGRILLVDDTEALARGTFSGPLFPGKVVTVDGTFDRRHLFHASSITRFTSIDAQTPRDS